ncbi:hypothetical protein DPX16_3488 [Anabarilius grahami]|uniref:Uncharacterized protein n=1 Tax=Anabarilius grahami TaxID=495550 RepID=A0A3N0Y7N3_ANAGA|nr:hypothetical protein DPX16_3488 [Anabarilius grahami]
MWLLKTFDQLFAISIVITLLLELSTCYGSEYGVSGEIIYSREFLISLRTASGGIIPDIPMELCRLHARSKHRKRGRRGGLHRRLKNLRLDNRRKLPPLPTILLSNVQSLRHKTDELEAWIKCKPGIRDTCLLAFSETWLRELDRDEDLIMMDVMVNRLDSFEFGTYTSPVMNPLQHSGIVHDTHSVVTQCRETASKGKVSGYSRNLGSLRGGNETLCTLL